MYSSIGFFLQFRKRVTDGYPELFGEELEEGQEPVNDFSETTQFAKRWGWYQSIYGLAKGDVTKFDEIELNTATHWKFRDECSKCPVLQMCKGSCMFLEDEYFKISCDSAYSDHIPFFAAAFEEATGDLPYAIRALDDNYQLPAEREDLWGPADLEVMLPEVRSTPKEL